jgi:hypothetical protein
MAVRSSVAIPKEECAPMSSGSAPFVEPTTGTFFDRASRTVRPNASGSFYTGEVGSKGQ